MTLAMLQIGAGICALLVRGQIAYTVPKLIITLGSASIGPVPWIVIVAAVFLLVGHVVLTYTRFGRYVYMTGGNREAAEYSGRQRAGDTVGGDDHFGGVFRGCGDAGGGIFRQRAAERIRYLFAG